MRDFIVQFRNGEKVLIKAANYTTIQTLLERVDEAGKIVALFPFDAINGVWDEFKELSKPPTVSVNFVRGADDSRGTIPINIASRDESRPVAMNRAREVARVLYVSFRSLALRRTRRPLFLVSSC